MVLPLQTGLILALAQLHLLVAAEVILLDRDLRVVVVAALVLLLLIRLVVVGRGLLGKEIMVGRVKLREPQMVAVVVVLVQLVGIAQQQSPLLGGAGLTSAISGTAYAGGGGGTSGTATAGLGGSGGGGNGSNSSSAGAAGTANTGGGGGGSGVNPWSGGAGGSGIVLLKYPSAYTITIGAGLTGSTAAASGGFIVTTITAGTGNVSWA